MAKQTYLRNKRGGDSQETPFIEIVRNLLGVIVLLILIMIGGIIALSFFTDQDRNIVAAQIVKGETEHAIELMRLQGTDKISVPIGISLHSDYALINEYNADDKSSKLCVYAESNSGKSKLIGCEKLAKTKVTFTHTPGSHSRTEYEFITQVQTLQLYFLDVQKVAGTTGRDTEYTATVVDCKNGCIRNGEFYNIKDGELLPRMYLDETATIYMLSPSLLLAGRPYDPTQNYKPYPIYVTMYGKTNQKMAIVVAYDSDEKKWYTYRKLKDVKLEYIDQQLNSDIEEFFIQLGKAKTETEFIQDACAYLDNLANPLSIGVQKGTDEQNKVVFTKSSQNNAQVQDDFVKKAYDLENITQTPICENKLKFKQLDSGFILDDDAVVYKVETQYIDSPLPNWFNAVIPFDSSKTYSITKTITFLTQDNGVSITPYEVDFDSQIQKYKTVSRLQGTSGGSDQVFVFYNALLNHATTEAAIQEMCSYLHSNSDAVKIRVDTNDGDVLNARLFVPQNKEDFVSYAHNLEKLDSFDVCADKTKYLIYDSNFVLSETTPVFGISYTHELNSGHQVAQTTDTLFVAYVTESPFEKVLLVEFDQTARVWKTKSSILEFKTINANLQNFVTKVNLVQSESDLAEKFCGFLQSNGGKTNLQLHQGQTNHGTFSIDTKREFELKTYEVLDLDEPLLCLGFEYIEYEKGYELEPNMLVYRFDFTYQTAATGIAPSGPTPTINLQTVTNSHYISFVTESDQQKVLLVEFDPIKQKWVTVGSVKDATSNQNTIKTIFDRIWFRNSKQEFINALCALDETEKSVSLFIRRSDQILGPYTYASRLDFASRAFELESIPDQPTCVV
jgi:hypothetical protein